MIFASNLSTYLCDNFSKEAQGSGVPEIKTYLSGLRITQYVSFKSYIIKMLGLILMDSSGFFIGKEGPFIQMSTIIAKLITSTEFFKKLNEVKMKKLKKKLEIFSEKSNVDRERGSWCNIHFRSMLRRIDVQH